MTESTALPTLDDIRRHYAAAAGAIVAGGSSCCSPSPAGSDACCSTTAPDTASADGSVWGADRYSRADTSLLPIAAVEASLGCGNPHLIAELREGDRVLDLGSGGGIDVLLAARAVGPTGRAIGVDMTPEMLDLARANAAEAGLDADFLAGRIEELPLPSASVDVVMSNCVLNLSLDKAAALGEAFRVLAPGGRFAVSDVVAEDHLTPADRAERGNHVGCIAGAMSRSEYTAALTTAGFEDVSVTFTHEVADGLHGALVRANRPA